MSILTCMMQKYQAQKADFAGNPYESLSTQEKLNILNTKNGYIRPAHLETVQDLIQKQINAGMSEGDAAKWVHDSLESNLQHESLRTLGTMDQLHNKNFVDIDRAITTGIPLKHVAYELFDSMPGRNIKYGGVLENTIPWSQVEQGAQQRAAALLTPVVQKIPPSMMRGIPNVEAEMKLAKAVFGDGADHEMSQLAAVMQEAFQQMNNDLKSVNMRTLDTDRFLKGIYGIEQKIRKDQPGAAALLKKEGTINFEAIQKARPGQYLDAASQQEFLDKFITQLVSSNSLRDAELDELGHLLTFNRAEDYMEWTQRYGSGSMMGNLNRAIHAYAKEFAWGKTTGGSIEAWKAGLLDYAARSSPAEAAIFKDALEKKIALHHVSFLGEADGIVRQGGDLLKDTVVAGHLGWSGVSAVTHFPMVLVRSAQEGLSGFSMVGEGIKNLLTRLVPGQFDEFAARAAQAGINGDRTLQMFKKVVDTHNGNFIQRYFRQAAGSVANASQLPNAISAFRTATSSIIQQDIAREVLTGTAVADSGMSGLRHVGMTDADMAHIKQFVYSDDSFGAGVPHIDMYKLWNSGTAGQDAALKIHHLMDDMGIAGSPHGNSTWHAMINQLRNSNGIGKTTAALLGPLTGFAMSAPSHVMIPAMMHPTIGGKIGYTAASLAGMVSLGMLNYQILRLSRLQDLLPWDSPQLAMQGISRSAFGSPLMAVTGDLGTNGRADGNILERFLPASGIIHDSAQTIQHEAYSWAQGKPNKHRADDWSKLGSDFGRGQNLPLIPHLLDRVVFGPIHHELDPADARAHDQKLIDNERKHAKGTYFWEPGQTSPDHNPFTGK